MASEPHGFREEGFLSFFHYKSMGANDPLGVIGRIYVGDTKQCYTLNSQAVGLMVL